MPSAPRCPPALRGFTLVEMLVVLVLLGVLAAATTMLLVAPDERRTLEREASRLAGALEQASATAQWRGETLGISADGPAYRFWRRDGDARWRVIVDDEVLAPRALPASVAIAADRFAGATVARDAILPLRPSGRNEPFRIVLFAGGWAVPVESDPLNRVTFRVTSRANAGG